jgi:hypothetical protein
LNWIECRYKSNKQLFSYIKAWRSHSQWKDDDVRFLLDQHASLIFIKQAIRIIRIKHCVFRKLCMYKLRQITHKLYIKSFGFEPQPGHTLEHEIGICCLFNPYNSYFWTSCLFSTLNINISWWIILSYSYAVTLQKK